MVKRILANYDTLENKQIFITLDEADAYGNNAKKSVQNNTCLRLDSEALFGKEWGKKKHDSNE